MSAHSNTYSRILLLHLWVIRDAAYACHCRYGIREALAIASEEGLESMWERHHRLHLRLWEGLDALGLEPFVEKQQYRLASVTTIKVQALCSLSGCCPAVDAGPLFHLLACMALLVLSWCSSALIGSGSRVECVLVYLLKL